MHYDKALQNAFSMRLLFVRARILRLAAVRSGPIRAALVRLASLLCVTVALAPLPVLAQDRITLDEILPVLSGTELGATEIADAPPPGGVRTVTRAEVTRAVRERGATTDGLDIPRVTRIERRGEHLEPDELVTLTSAALHEAMAPCELSDVQIRNEADLPAGERVIDVERPARLASGGVAFTVRIAVGEHTARVAGQGVLRCPEPIVSPGTAVTVRVTIGAVRVTARGICREEGRAGDVVRVRIDETSGLVQARVLDASTVEVVR